MIEEQSSRTEMVLGSYSIEKLRNSSVIISDLAALDHILQRLLQGPGLEQQLWLTVIRLLFQILTDSFVLYIRQQGFGKLMQLKREFWISILTAELLNTVFSIFLRNQIGLIWLILTILQMRLTQLVLKLNLQLRPVNSVFQLFHVWEPETKPILLYSEYRIFPRLLSVRFAE